MVVYSIEDLYHISSLVWDLAGQDSQLCQTAVAWLVVNRLGQAGDADAIVATCRAIRAEAGFGETSVEQLTRSDMARFSEVQKRVALVLDRARADPTGGAARLHRHDEIPPWSLEAEPSALIGAYLFYPLDRGLWQEAHAREEKNEL